MYPIILATALIVLCLTSAVLLSLINQQCNDVALFTPLGPSDDLHPFMPSNPPSTLTSTAPNQIPQGEEEGGSSSHHSSKHKGGHHRDRSKDGEHKASGSDKSRHSHHAVASPSEVPPSSSTGGAGIASDCVGICCMSFLSRLVLILAFFCNAVLLSLVLCSSQGVPGEAARTSLIPFPLPTVSSSAVHRCASYLLLAVAHFLLTGAVVLLMAHQQSRVINFPSFHSSLLFSSYILLLFTSFCIEALSLLSAISPPTTTPPPPPLSLSFLPPDPETERLLFHSLPSDPVQSLSSTAFAFLPSYIIPCVGDERCGCHLQRGEEGHVCKEMDEGRKRKKRRTRSTPHERERMRSEERGEGRRKREEEEAALIPATAEMSHSTEGGDSDEPSPVDSDEEWELERGRVETFDFTRGLVVSTTTPSYSPRYGTMSSLMAHLPSPLSGGERQSLLSSSMPNIPLLSLSSSQADNQRSLYLPSTSSSSSSSSSSPSLLPSVTTPLLPLPALPSSCTCVCAICLSRFHAHSVVKLISCGHRYHISCLRPWAARRTTCPLCRAPLTAKAEGEERRWGRAGQGRSVSFSG